LVQTSDGIVLVVIVGSGIITTKVSLLLNPPVAFNSCLPLLIYVISDQAVLLSFCTSTTGLKLMFLFTLCIYTGAIKSSTVSAWLPLPLSAQNVTSVPSTAIVEPSIEFAFILRSTLLITPPIPLDVDQHVVTLLVNSSLYLIF